MEADKPTGGQTARLAKRDHQVRLGSIAPDNRQNLARMMTHPRISSVAPEETQFRCKERQALHGGYRVLTPA